MTESEEVNFLKSVWPFLRKLNHGEIHLPQISSKTLAPSL